MNIMSPVAVPAAPIVRASAIIAAAHRLLALLERGQRVDSASLRTAMETAFDASDATGVWDWKTAYEPANARPSCSCANTDVRFSAEPTLRLHGFPPYRKLLASCRRTPVAQVKPGASAILDAGPAGSCSRHRRRDHAARHRRSLRPARACSPSSLRSAAVRCSSTSWRKPAPICSPRSFRP